MPDAELLVELYKHSKNSAPSLEIDVLQVRFYNYISHILKIPRSFYRVVMFDMNIQYAREIDRLNSTRIQNN